MTRRTRHNYVFVGGLHRSGTSLLTACLDEHPGVSCLRGSGVAENEGQHLQDVYPTARFFGGPGTFGFSKQAHLTDRSHLVQGARARLIRSWAPYWDLSKTTLVEKSPPNLIRTRFLQAVFPAARFVMIIRHPAAVAVATQKWSNTTLLSLVEHWLICHERLLDDARTVRGLRVVWYEDLVQDPVRTLGEVSAFLRIKATNAVRVPMREGLNDRYFAAWIARPRAGATRRWAGIEKRVNAFGYSLTSLEQKLPPSRLIARRFGAPLAR